MGPGPIYSLGQKQSVLEPYSLSLSSMVATLIPKYFLLVSQNMSSLPTQSGREQIYQTRTLLNGGV